MTTAKKASASIVDDEAALVEKIAQDIQPTGGVEVRQNAKALPAYASEPANGAPSTGPSAETGMTAVVDSSQPVSSADAAPVRMVNADGVEAEIDADNVKIHERSGWKRVKEEEA
jgi:hypothetical protein